MIYTSEINEAIEHIEKEETSYIKYGVIIRHDKKKNHLWVTLNDATPESQDFICRILEKLHNKFYLSKTYNIVRKKKHDESFPHSAEAQVPDTVGNLLYVRIVLRVIKTFKIGESIIFTGVDMKFTKNKRVMVVSEGDSLEDSTEDLTFDKLLSVC